MNKRNNVNNYKNKAQWRRVCAASFPRRANARPASRACYTSANDKRQFVCVCLSSPPNSPQLQRSERGVCAHTHPNARFPLLRAGSRVRAQL